MYIQDTTLYKNKFLSAKSFSVVIIVGFIECLIYIWSLFLFFLPFRWDYFRSSFLKEELKFVDYFRFSTSI